MQDNVIKPPEAKGNPARERVVIDASKSTPPPAALEGQLMDTAELDQSRSVAELDKIINGHRQEAVELLAKIAEMREQLDADNARVKEIKTIMATAQAAKQAIIGKKE